MTGQKAIDSLGTHPLYWEARAECDRHGIGDPEGLMRVIAALSHRRFMDETEHLRKFKIDRYMMTIPRITRASDGRVTSEYQFSESDKADFAQVDAMIESVRLHYFPETLELGRVAVWRATSTPPAAPTAA